MQDEQKTILYAAVAGIGAFFLGRWTAPDAPTINIAPVADDEPTPIGDNGPLPPLPPPVSEPAPPTGDALPGTHADKWDALAWDVELYPSYADPTTIRPPAGPAEPATSMDCSIVAIPAAWWDRAGETVGDIINSGITDIDGVTARLFRVLLPQCWDADTEALALLRDEVARRLEDLPGIDPPYAVASMRNPPMLRSRRRPMGPLRQKAKARGLLALLAARPRRVGSRRMRR